MITPILSFFLVVLIFLPAFGSGHSGVEKIAIIGTRSKARSIIDSAVPLDIVSVKELQRQGVTDMNSMLKTLIPSYYVTSEPISDAASFVRPAQLRGLGPDHTLILVNGKRRHRSSVVALTSGPWSRGSQGPDLAVIPAIALKQVEVLRDGASAQYGSDAIAGAMNFVLKEARRGGSFQVQYGSFYEGDGVTPQYSANVGLPLTQKGFANLSLEFRQVGATDRSVQRIWAQKLIDVGNTHVPNPAQPWGTPSVDKDLKVFLNSGLDLGSFTRLYVFGNYAQRNMTQGFFFRNPQRKAEVFRTVQKISEPDWVQDTLLVGALNDLGSSCPTVFLSEPYKKKQEGDKKIINVLQSSMYEKIADNSLYRSALNRTVSDFD